MKKTITAVLLGILLIGAFGAVVASAVTPNDTRANYGPGFMHRWTARYADPGDGAGNFPYCPYYNADGTVELEVETIDEAFEIARAEIDADASRDDIYLMGRWWIVYYEDEDGAYTQARIDAVTGEVFTGYGTSAGPQAGVRYGRGHGYARGFGYCMGYGN